MSLSAQRLELYLGASASATVTAGGSAASGDVAFEVAGAPDWAEVTLSPVSYVGGQATSTLTLTTAGDDTGVAPATFTLTVTASDGSRSASADLTVDVDLLTVRGSLTGALGYPFHLPDLQVSVNGGEPVAVGADGTFTGPQVAVPYDLVVFSPGASYGHLIEGLTTTDLKVMMPDAGMPPADLRMATIDGAFPAPVPAGHRAMVCVEGVGVEVRASCESVAAGSSAYSLGLSWTGDEEVPVVVRALMLELASPSDLPADYPQTARANVNVAHGATEVVDLTWQEGPGATDVTVVFTPPAGTVPAVSFLMHADADGVLVPLAQVATKDAFTAALPAEPGASLWVLTLFAAPNGSAVSWERVAHPTGRVEVTATTPARPLWPPSDTTSLNADTEFELRKEEGAPVTMTFMSPTESGATVLRVTTTAQAVKIPDLTPLGVPFPASGAPMIAAVGSLAGAATVEETLALDEQVYMVYLLPEATSGTSFPFPGERGTLGFYPAWTFTME